MNPVQKRDDHGNAVHVEVEAVAQAACGPDGIHACPAEGPLHLNARGTRRGKPCSSYSGTVNSVLLVTIRDALPLIRPGFRGRPGVFHRQPGPKLTTPRPPPAASIEPGAYETVSSL